MGCYADLVAWLIAPLLTQEDSENDVVAKTSLTVCMTHVAFLGLLGVLVSNRLYFVHSLQNYWLIWVVVYSVGGYLWLRRVRRVTHTFIYLYAAILVVAAMVMDLHAASAPGQARRWPFFIAIFDLLVVCRVGDLAINIVVAITVFWVLLTSIESGFRFGLYDIPGLSPVQQRIDSVSCEALPCPSDAWPSSGVTMLAVLLLGFSVTRGFARELHHEREGLLECVDVARLLAQYLAAYDLDAADRCLQAGKLPADMDAVFDELLANLRAYRPFLPDSLFPQVRGDDSSRRSFSSSSDGASMGSPTGRRSPCRSRPLSPAAALTASVSVMNLTESGAMGSVATHPSFARLRERSHLSAGSHTGRLTPPCTPPSLRNTMTINRPASLEHKRMSLMCIEDSASEPNSVQVYDGFIDAHTALLSAVFDAVKAHRGSLDYFHGERIYASFNAFGRALNHGSNALAASCKITDMHAATVAVVTGMADAGYLGTAAVRSPSIVGNLPVMLEQVLRCAVLVKEGVVCCRATAREAGMQHPLRQLVHRCLLMGCKDDFGEVLYANAQLAGGGATGGDEWMYELAKCGAQAWEEYNTAAKLLFTHGVDAALAHSHRADRDEAVAQRFANDVRQAMVVDVRPRLTPCTVLGDAVDRIIEYESELSEREIRRHPSSAASSGDPGSPFDAF
eukprot:TRINITY_DN2544_c0_g4_i1.p1 TRINITY_DN2544_c0_g4~~TRINITY_DN2544_c0_g4_i1.p1  ORF type:complete len:678 (+),score=164.50 TRINITY_DN2544_c0_g4_i1:61-2094(+)